MRQRDQQLTSALLDLFGWKRRVAQDLEEEIRALLDVAPHELRAQTERVPSREAVDAGGERVDRASEALAGMMTAAAGEEASEEIVDAVVLGTLEQQAAERDRAERDERRRVMLFHDEADAVVERPRMYGGAARGAHATGGANHGR